MKSNLLVHFNDAEQILTVAPDDLRCFIRPFLYQMNKLKEMPPEIFEGIQGRSVLMSIENYLKSAKRINIDRDELYTNLVVFTVKALFLIKDPVKTARPSAIAIGNYLFHKN